MSKFFNLFGLVVLFVFIFLSFAYPQTSTEQLVITTYYPSPYGSYADLTANRMKIGTGYSPVGILFVNDGLIVEGNVGIGTPTPGTARLAVVGGGVVVGSPTGGDKGAGTINAVGVYDDDTLLTDYVFDKYFDGKVKEEDLDKHGNYEMKSLDEMISFIEKERHLPNMIGRKEWEMEGSASLGKIVTQLWETVETQAIYIKELKERIALLENKLGS